VFFRKKNKPRERFYLLPGQGGRNYHRKQRRLLWWSVAVALLFGLVLAAVMWWLSRPKL
jgi:Na+-driven multidrug efflux pump